MSDSLKIAADSIADTLTQAAGGLDAFNQALVCVVLLSIFIICAKTVKHFIKNKSVVVVNTAPKIERRLCIRELLWAFVNILTGGVILVVSWEKDCDTNSRLLMWMGILAVCPILFFVGNHLYRRKCGIKDGVVGLIEKTTSEVLWVFWLVLAGFYIASEFMNFSWDDIVDLWQNRVEYTRRIIEDLCAMLIVTLRVLFVIIKHKRAVKKEAVRRKATPDGL